MNLRFDGLTHSRGWYRTVSQGIETVIQLIQRFNSHWVIPPAGSLQVFICLSYHYWCDHSIVIYVKIRLLSCFIGGGKGRPWGLGTHASTSVPMMIQLGKQIRGSSCDTSRDCFLMEPQQGSSVHRTLVVVGVLLDFCWSQYHLVIMCHWKGCQKPTLSFKVQCCD